jgi:hypothetical protein
LRRADKERLPGYVQRSVYCIPLVVPPEQVLVLGEAEEADANEPSGVGVLGENKRVLHAQLEKLAQHDRDHVQPRALSDDFFWSYAQSPVDKIIESDQPAHSA